MHVFVKRMQAAKKEIFLVFFREIL